MQAAGHNQPHGTGSLVPALAKNARAGHPQFRNGKGKHEKPGHPPVASDSGGDIQTGAHAPFGEEYSFTVQYPKPSIFTGQEDDGYDNPTTYYFQERNYPSSQGRWLSPDPAGLAAVDPSNPQSWNRYAYVLNNPLSAIDPLGLDCAIISGADGGDRVAGAQSVTVGPGDCPGSDPNNEFYFDGKVSGAYVDANGNVVASVNGKLACSGDSGCAMWDALITSVNVSASAQGVNTTTVPFTFAPLLAANNGLNPNSTLGWSWNFTKSLVKNFSVGSCASQFLEEMFDPSDMGGTDAAIKTTAQSGAYVAALTYSAQQGLVVPMRSSIVRGILDFGEFAGEAAALALTDYEGIKALKNEVNSFASGECQ
jgi:RHS repeat-associated protein